MASRWRTYSFLSLTGAVLKLCGEQVEAAGTLLRHCPVSLDGTPALGLASRSALLGVYEPTQVIPGDRWDTAEESSYKLQLRSLKHAARSSPI